MPVIAHWVSNLRSFDFPCQSTKIEGMALGRILCSPKVQTAVEQSNSSGLFIAAPHDCERFLSALKSMNWNGVLVSEKDIAELGESVSDWQIRCSDSLALIVTEAWPCATLPNWVDGFLRPCEVLDPVRLAISLAALRQEQLVEPADSKTWQTPDLVRLLHLKIERTKREKNLLGIFRVSIERLASQKKKNDLQRLLEYFCLEFYFAEEDKAFYILLDETSVERIEQGCLRLRFALEERVRGDGFQDVLETDFQIFQSGRILDRVNHIAGEDLPQSLELGLVVEIATQRVAALSVDLQFLKASETHLEYIKSFIQKVDRFANLSSPQGPALGLRLSIPSLLNSEFSSHLVHYLKTQSKIKIYLEFSPVMWRKIKKMPSVASHPLIREFKKIFFDFVPSDLSIAAFIESNDFIFLNSEVALTSTILKDLRECFQTARNLGVEIAISPPRSETEDLLQSLDCRFILSNQFVRMSMHERGQAANTYSQYA